MISKKIVESARFLKMPVVSQNLYFHLLVNADDDGIVEGFPVLSLCRADDEDLQILVEKGFVQILNEDLVTYIDDWLEHNKVRLDRKTDSIYQDLLLSVVPDVELRLKEPREDDDSQVTDICQTSDSQVTAQDRVGEDNILSLLEEGAITLADLDEFSDELKERMEFIMKARER